MKTLDLCYGSIRKAYKVFLAEFFLAFLGAVTFTWFLCANLSCRKGNRSIVFGVVNRGQSKSPIRFFLSRLGLIYHRWRDFNKLTEIGAAHIHLCESNKKHGFPKIQKREHLLSSFWWMLGLREESAAVNKETSPKQSFMKSDWLSVFKLWRVGKERKVQVSTA